MGDQEKDPLAKGNSPDANQGEDDAQDQYAKDGGVTDVESEAKRSVERTSTTKTTNPEK